MTSIRSYLLRSLMVMLFAISVLMGAFIYFNALGEVNELYDKNMEELALTLQSQLDPIHMLSADKAGKFAVSTTRGKLKGEEEFLVQVWNKKGLLYSSHPSIVFPLMASPEQTPRHVFMTSYEGRAWRVYYVENEHGVIQIAQPKKSRSLFLRQIALHMMLPAVVQIPLLGFFIWLAVGRSLRPLNAVSEAIKNRTATSMEPLSVEETPLEIQPMVEELNALLARLSSALQAQQRFVADAAHELRTPLTALQLQLNVLARAKEASERATFIQKLQSGIVRASHLVHQLLTLARLEPEAVARQFRPVELMPVVKAVAESHLETAAEKKIDIGFPRLEPMRVKGDAEGLRVLIGNLLDNALRYTPVEGRVDVSVYQEGNTVVLEVEDTGIGIPEKERLLVFERFHRVLGTELSGTGLGLAIVKRVVEQHEGTVRIATGRAGKGTRFIVTMPLA